MHPAALTWINGRRRKTATIMRRCKPPAPYAARQAQPSPSMIITLLFNVASRLSRCLPSRAVNLKLEALA